MKEITLSAMPPCFEKWCSKFDYLWKNQGQKKGFRYYLAGLLGESKRKNIAQMTDNIIGSSYHNVHHFLSKSSWSASAVNECRVFLWLALGLASICRVFILASMHCSGFLFSSCS